MTGMHFGDNIHTHGDFSVGKMVGQPTAPSQEKSSGPGVAWKTPFIFVNYRNYDEKAATYLDEELTDRLGAGAVFRDAGMPAGTEFPRKLLDMARGCRLMLAVIGEKWDRPGHGLPLLHDPRDWVRVEIGTALANDVTVVPIMVGARSRLNPDDLPADVRQLAYLQARHLRDGYDRQDVHRLVAQLL